MEKQRQMEEQLEKKALEVPNHSLKYPLIFRYIPLKGPYGCTPSLAALSPHGPPGLPSGLSRGSCQSITTYREIHTLGG